MEVSNLVNNERKAEIISILHSNYPMHFDQIEFLRDAGSATYAVYSEKTKYFLKVTKPSFNDTVIKSIGVHAFLQNYGFSVPRIFYTKADLPYVQINVENGVHLFILYELLARKVKRS